MPVPASWDPTEPARSTDTNARPPLLPPRTPAAGVLYRARLTQQGGRRALLQAPISISAESVTPTIEFVAGQGSPPVPQLCGREFAVEAQWQSAAGASVWVAAPGTVATGPCPA